MILETLRHQNVDCEVAVKMIYSGRLEDLKWLRYNDRKYNNNKVLLTVNIAPQITLQWPYYCDGQYTTWREP